MTYFMGVEMQKGARNHKHPVLSFPVLFDALSESEVDCFASTLRCTPEALKSATRTAIWTHHLDATIASEALGKRPVILELTIGLPRDAAVFYSIEPDGALIRGYSWTIDHEPLDYYDGGFFVCDHWLPTARRRSRDPVIPQCVAESLVSVLDHFLPDESRDFEAADKGSRGRHVFRDLQILEEWLRHIAGTDLIA